MTKPHPRGGARCLSCQHFRNAPDYLEQAIPGLNTMSSGHASVRKDDGVCLLHDLYLSADARCGDYRAAVGTTEVVP